MGVFRVPFIAFCALCLSSVKEVASFTALNNAFASKKVFHGSSVLRNQAFAPMKNQHIDTRGLANLDPTEEKRQLETTANAIQHVDVAEQKTTMKSGFFNLLVKRLTAFAVPMVFMFTTLFNPLPSIAAQSGGRMGGSFPTYSAPPSFGYNPGFSSYPNPAYFSSDHDSSSVPSDHDSSSGVAVQRRESLSAGEWSVFVYFGLFLSSMFYPFDSALGPGVSVAEISVAIEVPRRDDPNSILSVLDRISQTARTDSRVGIQNLTSQVALELLRRKSSIVSASTAYNHFRDRDQAHREFNRISIKERGKFERETISKYGGVDYSAESSAIDKQHHGSPQATMAVVTLVVEIEGDSTKMPKIRSKNDVEKALRRIETDTTVDKCLQSAEILWTPQERSETLTERDVIADYPGLRTLLL